jgi:predicted O-methyltransferase YrrM
VLLITGMHRSGTSLVSHLLQSAGVHVGDNLIAANVANPRGYFEDVDFYEFHEQLLHARGESYLHADADLVFQPSEAESERARQLIAARSSRRLWGWKDPRTSLFLDFWRELLPQARYLFVYRHPLDVLLSLLRRGEFDEHPNLLAGLQAWQTYNTKIANFYDRHPDECLLVHIDGIVNQVEHFSQFLQGKLQLDFQLQQESFDQIFHTGELRNVTFPPVVERILKKLQPGVMDLYHRLNACADLCAEGTDRAAENAALAPNTLSALNQVADSLSEPVRLSIKQSTLQLLVSVLATERSDEMLGRFNSNAKGLQQKVDTMWMYAQRLERTKRDTEELVRSQQAQIQLQASSISSQRAELELQQRQIASQNQQILEQDRVLSQQAAHLGSLSTELKSIHESLTWKIAHVVRLAKERLWKKTSMSNQAPHSGYSPIKGTMTQRIARVREMQTELRARPVTGSLRGLKRLFYQIMRSTFSRQFVLNSVTVDLIEALYRDLERNKPWMQATATQLQEQASRVNAPLAENMSTSSNGVSLASCGLTQDQAQLNNIRPLRGFDFVYHSPAEMRMPERVALYSLVFGLQPKNCLEIGSFRCGSSAIIFGALEDTGFGQLACVEPDPQVDAELWSRLRNRCRIFEGYSPDILPEVVRQTGGKFDFVLIDGDHHYESVLADVTALLPVLADEAYLLFHDAHSSWVKRAVEESVAKYPELIDCGLLSIESTVLHDNGQTETWAGLRLLRFKRTADH